ncbi:MULTISPECIES: hypothetical protein [unclassified Adlercreutzia]|uniref:hypothetical protein n=1 Tax=unclassified Adlercreutzia TaxID=2636013 RepID=UPI0013EA915B|nr:MULTISPECIES: hypothetical protein [unclassified Adlercreutzia]
MKHPEFAVGIALRIELRAEPGNAIKDFGASSYGYLLVFPYRQTGEWRTAF